MKTYNLQYIDIEDFELDDLKIDKKDWKDLTIITLIVSTKIKNLWIIVMNCIYQLRVFLDII